jgi:hypothetical protein
MPAVISLLRRSLWDSITLKFARTSATAVLVLKVKKLLDDGLGPTPWSRG